MAHLGEDIWKLVVPHLFVNHDTQLPEGSSYSQKDLCAMMRVSKSMYAVTGPTFYNHVQIRCLRTFLFGVNAPAASRKRTRSSTDSDVVSQGPTKPEQDGRAERVDHGDIVDVPQTTPRALMSKSDLVKLVQKADFVWERPYGRDTEWSKKRTEWQCVPLAISAFRHILRLSLSQHPKQSYIPPDAPPYPKNTKPRVFESPVPDDTHVSCVVTKSRYDSMGDSLTSLSLPKEVHTASESHSDSDIVHIHIAHRARASGFLEQYLVPGAFNRIYFDAIDEFECCESYSSHYAHGLYHTLASAVEAFCRAWRGSIPKSRHTSIEFVIPVHLQPDRPVRTAPLEREVLREVKWRHARKCIKMITVRQQDTTKHCLACGEKTASQRKPWSPYADDGASVADGSDDEVMGNS